MRRWPFGGSCAKTATEGFAIARTEARIHSAERRSPTKAIAPLAYRAGSAQLSRQSQTHTVEKGQVREPKGPN
ncbi:hypothetical protein VTK73DRAFT_4664 [Phialemonium thermophilum]|uniref:Uncharacterized protein n=1 Tax=Phialemonium thermophilum TaxID=223376 RepID=A0ABR3V7C6_9PEZI